MSVVLHAPPFRHRRLFFDCAYILNPTGSRAICGRWAKAATHPSDQTVLDSVAYQLGIVVEIKLLEQTESVGSNRLDAEF